jgi:glycosyltransferase involved in cell wall biosynthesis
VAPAVKILFVTMEYPPDTGIGGIAYNIGGMAPAMVELGHEVHVLSCWPDQETRDVDDRGVQVHRRPRVRVPGLRRVLPGANAPKRVEAVISAWREARKLDLHPDVVNIPDWMGEGLAFTFVPGLPTVSYLHTPLRLITEHNQRELGWPGKLADKLERTAVRRSTIVTSTSQLLADDLIELGWLGRDEVRVIPAPLDVERFAGVAPVRETGPVVLVIGRVEPRKAPEVVVRAVARLAEEIPDVELVLVGGSGGELHGRPYREEVAAEAERLGVRLTLVDHADRDEVLAWYGRSRVVAVPSHFESFSITAVEAAACRRPVICSTRVGAREVLGDDPALTVPVGDVDALVDRLRPFLLDAELAARTGDRLHDAVEERCAPVRVAARRVEVYEEAIERVGRTGRRRRVL